MSYAIDRRAVLHILGEVDTINEMMEDLLARLEAEKVTSAMHLRAIVLLEKKIDKLCKG